MKIERVLILMEMDDGSQDIVIASNPRKVDIETTGRIQSGYAHEPEHLKQDVAISITDCTIKHVSKTAKEIRRGI